MHPTERELLDITESFIDRSATMDRQGIHIEHRFIMYCELPDGTVVRAGMDVTPGFMLNAHPVGLAAVLERCVDHIKGEGRVYGLTDTNGKWWGKYERVIYEAIDPWQTAKSR